ncbi:MULTISPECIES: hypothetical protein [Alteromonadaceae]|uniref:hypothetical protein n=1 Tax=Alteromonadaceae TaxID=72275 RepID=UPI001C09FB47|nr:MULTISPECIES: hypothetical protein [Aliiglaciecola]MBU2877428.1 hypothetical protein [Aliiglaciecola lipolytica]MDO6712852.1 hypothetical protein [Aliiglaciecola sp. 2_MG-2023]MDO6753947.1 hypothetical protein [Aliiglaciecola sp. 1_MG-2023]
MSCLTRKLQQNLTRYVKKHSANIADKPVECVKEELVDKGLCPSHITDDQMREILRCAYQSGK